MTASSTRQVSLEVIARKLNRDSNPVDAPDFDPNLNGKWSIERQGVVHAFGSPVYDADGLAHYPETHCGLKLSRREVEYESGPRAVWIGEDVEFCLDCFPVEVVGL